MIQSGHDDLHCCDGASKHPLLGHFYKHEEADYLCVMKITILYRTHLPKEKQHLRRSNNISDSQLDSDSFRL